MLAGGLLQLVHAHRDETETTKKKVGGSAVFEMIRSRVLAPSVVPAFAFKPQLLAEKRQNTRREMCGGFNCNIDYSSRRSTKGSHSTDNTNNIIIFLDKPVRVKNLLIKTSSSSDG